MSFKTIVYRGTIFLTLWVVIPLLIVEVIVRWGMNYNMSFDERRLTSLQFEPSGYTRQNMLKQRVIGANENGVPDPDRVWYDIDSIGSRSRIVETPDTSTVRIVYLGGSHVFDIHAYQYKGLNSWPEQVGEKLRKDGHNVHVINLGMPGGDTNDALARTVFQLRDMRPDIVVVCSQWNDLKWIVNADERGPVYRWKPAGMKTNPLVEPVGPVDAALAWSATYRKVRDAYWRWELGIDGNGGVVETLGGNSSHLRADAINIGLNQYATNLSMIIDIVRSWGGTPVLATEARLVAASNTSEDRQRIRYDFIPGKPAHQELVRLFALTDSVLAETAKREVAFFINPHSEVGGNTDAFADHIHTTERGSTILAQNHAMMLKGVITSGRDKRILQKIDKDN